MTELLEDNTEIDLAIVDVDTNIEWVESDLIEIADDFMSSSFSA